MVQRAYTLRLRGLDRNDQSWRDALWRTHEAVNNGAKVFGDWLLTLRGGLDHTLADTIKGGKGKPDRDPTDEERKARRILLALSWLSVESKLGAPADFIVASGEDDAKDRNGKVIAALKEILESRGVAKAEIERWVEDCSASLSAAIRDDAVWVNRSKAFDEAVESFGASFKRDDVWDMLFFGSREAYLAPAKGSEDESSETELEEKAKDLVKKAGQWLSRRFGTGKGADFSRMAEVYQKIADWAASPSGSATVDDLVRVLWQHFGTEEAQPKNGLDWMIDLSSYRGHSPNPVHKLLKQNTSLTETQLKDLHKKANTRAKSCRSKISSKGRRPYSDAVLNDVESVCGFTYRSDTNGQNVSVSDYSKYSDDYKWGPARHYEYAVILDHAARRVSLAHTWIKRAEAERRKFEEDAKKIDQVPKAAKDWLDRFCLERSGTTGALEPYRIRRRAVDGWKEVVAAWSKADCKTTEDRIAAARAIQDDPEIDKFGDTQLFEALAEDDALCVWHKDGMSSQDPDPQPLLYYVAASEAEFKKRHFKVPAYRHPDPLLHPVFCDFGNSRWFIDFSIHKAAHQLDDAEKRVKAKHKEVEKARKSLERYAGKKEKSAKAKKRLEDAEKKLAKAEQDLDYLRSGHQMEMKLFNGWTVEEFLLAWQSKRLARDLALRQRSKEKESSKVVTRADRLGRAASNVTKSDEVNIAGLFEQKYWNGRLQAPRRQLEAIARYVEKHDWDDKAKKMRDTIQWLMTFSAELQPQGPWMDYAAKFADDAPAKPFVSRRGEYAVKRHSNDARQGHARLILSRLPGLRVLAVDLGHRYAAACAVWEALSNEDFKKEIEGRKILRGGTDENALYCHTEHETNEMKHVTIYRRIGADTLPDRTPHPAPWARLDRQFLIKLQGEEEGAREASNEEIWQVHQMEAAIGRRTPLIDRLVGSGWGSTEKQKARLEALKNLGWQPVENMEADNATTGEEAGTFRPSLSVDALMSSAVRTLRLALKRHGDRARIAHYLITDETTRPGGIKEKLDENGRIELLKDALAIWHDLFSSRGWRDDAAKKLWDDHIAKLHEYEAPEEIGKDISSADRKKKREENQEKLRNAAKDLARDVTLRKALHDAWKKRWEEDDVQWKKQLRWFKDWILPRGKAADDPTIRKVGGLSLTRLATLTEFRRKVQVGFFTRLHPGGSRDETKEKFGQSTLDALEKLREQRVKQLASRIVEAALGVGRMKRPRGGKDPKRPDVRVDEPCHAVVIEDLTHYRPEETRTRRENRQLMAWSSSKVKKYLAEACELHGLHLREIPAAYTSRQDSRTGAPGIRCQDVPVKEFMRSPFWRRQVKLAEEKRAKNKGGAYEHYLCYLNAEWIDKTNADWEKAGVVRVPLRGGEIFISADSNSPAAKGIQADLNAAANIGLKALLDPDWPGKWWYVPCDPATFKPVKAKVKGSAAVDPDHALPCSDQSQSGDAATGEKKRGEKSKRKSGEVVNLWRDVSSSSIATGDWKNYAAYWNDVQARVIDMMSKLNSCDSTSAGTPLEDDVPL
ncbi:type V CRISPR-associated protein Cas12b [Dissulfurirhabdus thermomarina]|uniref:Type V CRISPR-associated protein Cas12b n=1 Tax=Dissulfurirhabdus thermomarina TaxID=1765737 RepID=A0A6N9TP17_DISTH|nr:type V CRISPR-associated protein Cas12b [Dissulfurirhabdus thermomarina]NDY42909.1 type V CRISPR-associated protein Cas12b [Dissulfurirhabdus thermomarina]